MPDKRRQEEGCIVKMNGQGGKQNNCGEEKEDLQRVRGECERREKASAQSKEIMLLPLQSQTLKRKDKRLVRGK